MKRIWVLLLVILFCACNDNIRNTDEGKVYYYEPLHWEMQIPDDWKVLSKIERKQMVYKAQGYYEEDDLQKQYGQKNIIMGLQKPEDKITAVYAFTRSYRSGDFPPQLKDILKQQYQSYSSGAYTADTSLSVELINDKSFEKAVLNVSYNSKPYFSYITYSTELSDTLTFGVSIISDNTTDSLLLYKSFVKSVMSL